MRGLPCASESEWQHGEAGALYLLPLWHPGPAIDRAARLGDGWLAAPALSPQQARRQLELYLERCEAHGRPRERVVEAFRELASMGYEDVIVRNPVQDPGPALACIERLAEVRARI